MVETPSHSIDGLLQTLAALSGLVNGRPLQPLHQLAESAVLYWLRVVDGKETLLPRLNASRYMPGSFPFGMERRQEHRIDQHPPAKQPAPFAAELARRLDALGSHLEAYFVRDGYRSSSDQCDQVMMEVSRCSRFLTSCAQDAELQAAATPGLNEDGSLEPDAAAETLHNQQVLRMARRALLIWEPLLNEVVVTWEQNALNEFDRTLTNLRDVLALPEGEREAYEVPPGYPMRPQGRARCKVSSFSPALRPLRTKSMFSVRAAQLERRIGELDYQLAGLAGPLEEDMLHFIQMIQRNHFMLANEPGFWDTHRPGLPLVRGRPTSHPFLIDPMDFFKKAVLFHNRTYTVAGGGIDLIYLQVNQLARFYRFNNPAGARLVQPHLTLCRRRWEENKWDAFTEELLRLAERLRAAGEAAGA